MTRLISGEYRSGRRLLTGMTDPSGLGLRFSLDGSRVFCQLEATRALLGKARVLPAGLAQSVADDLAHATVAALAKRIGVTRESRLRFLKPLYAGDTFRADGTLLGEANGLYTVSARLLSSKEQLCVEAEVEVFALTAAQIRRMTPDAMVPLELKRYLPI